MAINKTPKRHEKVEAWLARELKEQEARHRNIVKEMEALTPEREKWIQEFLQRIQSRGFNVHSSILRRIKAEEIPARPKRKLRVNY